jgi:preprotein translocase subunit SecF
VELFRGVNIDWLGKKWYFLAFSLIFSVAGVLSLLFWHHLPLDVDFQGGTQVRVRFDHKPDVDRIRQATDRAGLRDARVTSFTASASDSGAGNEVIIALPQRDTKESSLDAGRGAIIKALDTNYSQTAQANAGKLDLDTVGRQALTTYLTARDPQHLGSNPTADQHYEQQASAFLDYRDTKNGGLVSSIDNLNGIVDPAVVNQFKQDAFLSGFSVRSVEIVGPQVGAALRNQALLATLYSLAGMLVYLWFRFELIYGVAAVVAVFHDTLITVGFFSLFNMEISLTVIAAILTLIGYSMNDTIVVFDRIRENLATSRRESLADVVNRSINQTLSRTVLTSGLTFLTVLSLFFFGGEVLHPFSFALVVGILIGTYSSIAVAAPMLVAYQQWRSDAKGRNAALPAARRSKA